MPVHSRQPPLPVRSAKGRRVVGGELHVGLRVSDSGFWNFAKSRCRIWETHWFLDYDRLVLSSLLSFLFVELYVYIYTCIIISLSNPFLSLSLSLSLPPSFGELGLPVSDTSNKEALMPRSTCVGRGSLCKTLYRV